MGRSTYSGPIKSTNGVIVGSSGTQITTILKGTVSVNFASMLTDTVADLDVTVTGAAVGDIVLMQPPAADMTAGLIIGQAWVAAANTVTVRIFNQSAGTIDEAAATWNYLLIRS